ncbi:hypothetical protein [Ulvibacter litoralis]|uniref:Phage r1t holin n=1 Tax=Ulvibacter litoralis TaxID=227084 RepID=A0A1G7JBR0_9FLAO|nr:hypothetical protein [Ulvibacter litoralis]GHC64505.1 hypothetical protein GCM10008083_32150 [Ulvibacter litoralis]SDF22323.1 hypothetical protein SAMN05421855_11026 [Ulvibacter litoralis]
MKIIDRLKKPTPKFFRKIRNIGMAIVASGGAILAAPFEVPTVLFTIASYATVIGTVTTAISQAVVADEEEEQQNQKKT